MPRIRDSRKGREAPKTFELCGHQESDEPYIPERLGSDNPGEGEDSL